MRIPIRIGRRRGKREGLSWMRSAPDAAALSGDPAATRRSCRPRSETRSGPSAPAPAPQASGSPFAEAEGGDHVLALLGRLLDRIAPHGSEALNRWASSRLRCAQHRRSGPRSEARSSRQPLRLSPLDSASAHSDDHLDLRGIGAAGDLATRCRARRSEPPQAVEQQHRHERSRARRGASEAASVSEF